MLTDKERMLQEFTLQALKNMGHDTTCGACMGVAFTGATQSEHTCKEPRLILTDDQYTWLLTVLRQHARNMYVSLGNKPSKETRDFLALLNCQRPHALAAMPDMGLPNHSTE